MRPSGTVMQEALSYSFSIEDHVSADYLLRYFKRTSGQKDHVGGNKKAHAKPESNSRTANKQNAGGGGRNTGKDGG